MVVAHSSSFPGRPQRERDHAEDAVGAEHGEVDVADLRRVELAQPRAAGPEHVHPAAQHAVGGGGGAGGEHQEAAEERDVPEERPQRRPGRGGHAVGGHGRDARLAPPPCRGAGTGPTACSAARCRGSRPASRRRAGRAARGDTSAGSGARDSAVIGKTMPTCESCRPRPPTMLGMAPDVLAHAPALVARVAARSSCWSGRRSPRSRPSRSGSRAWPGRAAGAAGPGRAPGRRCPRGAVADAVAVAVDEPVRLRPSPVHVRPRVRLAVAVRVDGRAAATRPRRAGRRRPSPRPGSSTPLPLRSSPASTGTCRT